MITGLCYRKLSPLLCFLLAWSPYDPVSPAMAPAFRGSQLVITRQNLQATAVPQVSKGQHLQFWIATQCWLSLFVNRNQLFSTFGFGMFWVNRIESVNSSIKEPAVQHELDNFVLIVSDG